MRALIKVYGERNTGTNYLDGLLRLNLDADLLPGEVPRPLVMVQKALPGNEWLRDLYFRFSVAGNLGWKHACAPAPGNRQIAMKDGRAVFFLTLCKNPYSWLLSLHKRPYHRETGQAMTFETFLQSPWHTVERENAPAVFENPVALWNAKNRSYLDLAAGASALNLRYEDLVADPERVVGRIEAATGCSRKRPEFVNLEKSTKERAKDSSYYRDYYLQERWRDGLSPEAIGIINRHLDRDLAGQLGYDLLAVE